ncbi:MAG: AAA family ATPase [Phycisphaerales bacterium]|nr:AAA family ATPase [Phycisphaerales bacterium]
MAGYTCYSDKFLGCGSYHDNRKKAEGCCSVAEKMFGEKREPVRVDNRAAVDARPIYPAAEVRKAEWREKLREDKRKHYSTEDYAAAKGEDDGSTDMSTGDTSAAAMAEAAGEIKFDMGDGAATATADPQDPMALMAKALLPHIADPVGQRVADRLLPKIADIAEGAGSTGRVEEVLAKAEAAIANLDKRRKIEVKALDGETRDVDGDTHPLFEDLLKVVGAGNSAFLSGPAGSGKTTAAKQVAEALGMDYYIQGVALEKHEATGFVDAGGTYQPSQVYRWAKSDKPALLLIDEVDGWHPGALVAMNPILDNRIGIFPEGQFDIHPDSVVIATANTWGLGADAEYCGRNRLDAASLDRFGSRFAWGYDEDLERKVVEAKCGTDAANKVMPISLKIRKAVAEHGVKILWGPRQSINLGRNVAAGMSVKKALTFSALAACTDVQRKKVMAAIKDK